MAGIVVEAVGHTAINHKPVDHTGRSDSGQRWHGPVGVRDNRGQ